MFPTRADGPERPSGTEGETAAYSSNCSACCAYAPAARSTIAQTAGATGRLGRMDIVKSEPKSTRLLSFTSTGLDERLEREDRHRVEVDATSARCIGR